MSIVKKIIQFSIILSSFCLYSCSGTSPTPTPDPEPTPDPGPTPGPTPDPGPDPEPTDTLWDHTQDYLRTGKKTLNFYNLNDTHGAIESSSYEPGINKISTYLLNKKNEDPNSYVFTSSGDMWQGSADSNITRGKLMVDWMNYVGCSGMALGNHEFDWTIDTIRDNLKLSNFPYLACNIVDNKTGKTIDYAQPYTTITVNGIHVGIIGAIGEGITSSIIARNVDGLSFVNPTLYVKEYSTYLRNNGADFILFLYHNSTYTINSSLAPYIDGAFGGHNHSNERTYLKSVVPCLEGGSNGKYISHINATFDFDTAELTYGDCDYEAISTNLSDDRKTFEIRQKYAEEINTIKNTKVCYLDETITGDDLILYAEKAMQRYYEEILGGELPIFRYSHNQTRSPYTLYQGVVTYGDIYKVFPFDNFVTLCTVDLAHAKDNYVSYYPLGKVVTDDMKTPDGRVYVITIDYLATSEYATKYTNIVEIYYDAVIREVIADCLAEEYPYYS